MGKSFALEGNKCLPLSVSSSINYKTELEGKKNKKNLLKIRFWSRLFKAAMSLQVAVCEEGRQKGHLGHGDLHGLQHLLHRLHGAFVLLGPTTGQLRVREGR